MQTALFVTTTPLAVEGNGISIKIRAQVEALVELGYRVDVASVEQTGIIISTSAVPKRRTVPLSGAFRYSYLKVLADEILQSGPAYDLVYIRNPSGGLYALYLPYFLKKIRKIAKSVALEVPSYPYDREAKTIRAKFSLAIHKLARLRIRNYIDVVVYMGKNVDKIWGLPALQIYNCCNPADVPMAGKAAADDGVVKFVGVANLNYWHGYDRLIAGIAEYYRQGGRRAIEFHVVGDTEPTAGELRKLSYELGLSDHVIFHGSVHAEKLSQLLSVDMVGVDALARHRSGNNYNDSLKSKEYCFRGLPFIKSHEDEPFDDEDFVLTISADEAPVNVSQVLSWIDNLEFGSAEIRAFALNRFVWSRQLEKVLAHLRV
jgi:glycosyltransferase involved in cell wall biosynthesis